MWGEVERERVGQEREEGERERRTFEACSEPHRRRHTFQTHPSSANAWQIRASLTAPSCGLTQPPPPLEQARQRVAVARALAVNPQVLVCDEPVAALDVSIQAQILALLREVNEQGTALLFITHDLGVVRQVTSRVVVLYRGSIVEQGATDEVLDDPAHDYTRRLVASMPRSDGTWQPAGSQSLGTDLL